MMKRTTVLIGDDHEIVVEGLRRVLESEFEVVGAVADGLALVSTAEKIRPDVIVADVSMPRLNGIEAARQIRAGSKRTKIVFLSMHPDVVYVAEALRAGASAYVLKSSAGMEIVAAIREALRGGIFVTAAIDRAAVEAQMKRDQRLPDALPELSQRQREVVQMVAEGRSTKEIAGILNISPRTAEFHRYRAMQAIGVRTLAELVQYALKHRLVAP
jgi:DNA-binding NarL/FixJ family response regulator